MKTSNAYKKSDIIIKASAQIIIMLLTSGAIVGSGIDSHWATVFYVNSQ